MRFPYFAPQAGGEVTLLGIEWEQITTVAGDGNFNDIAYSPALGLWCAVASAGTGAFNNNRAMTSPDATDGSWTVRALLNGVWQGIAWSPTLNLFAAVKSDGGTTQIATSPDGITWTPRSFTGTTVTFQKIIWAKEHFVAVGATGTGAALSLTSDDGILWLQGNAASTAQWRDLAYSPEMDLLAAVAVTAGGTRLMTSSTDGLTWQSATAPSTQAWGAIGYGVGGGAGTGRFVALSQSGLITMHSIDGVNWIQGSVPGTAMTFAGCEWSPVYKMFAAVGTSGGGGTQNLATSPDGITWTRGSPPSELNQYNAIAWGVDRFAAASATIGAPGSAVMTSCARFSLD